MLSLLGTGSFISDIGILPLFSLIGFWFVFFTLRLINASESLFGIQVTSKVVFPLNPAEPLVFADCCNFDWPSNCLSAGFEASELDCQIHQKLRQIYRVLKRHSRYNQRKHQLLLDRLHDRW